MGIPIVNKQNVLIRFPGKLLADMDRIAAELSMNRTEVIREACRQYIQAQDERKAQRHGYNPAGLPEHWTRLD